MNIDKNMSAEEQQIKDLWYSRKPSHDLDPEGKDRFWGTLLMLFKEYASQQNKELIAENTTYISLLDDATKEISKRDKQIEELKEHLRIESDCVEHMKDVEVNYKKEIEELRTENSDLKVSVELYKQDRKVLNDENKSLKNTVDNISENFANLQVEYGDKCSELNELKKQNDKSYFKTLTPNNNEK